MALPLGLNTVYTAFWLHDFSTESVFPSRGSSFQLAFVTDLTCISLLCFLNWFWQPGSLGPLWAGITSKQTSLSMLTKPEWRQKQTLRYPDGLVFLGDSFSRWLIICCSLTTCAGDSVSVATTSQLSNSIDTASDSFSVVNFRPDCQAQVPTQHSASGRFGTLPIPFTCDPLYGF